MAAFLSILLLILKIIGIILLSILGIILLVIVLVLFVPVTYKLKGKYENKEPYFYAKAGWLFNLITVSFDLAREEKVNMRIIGISLRGPKKKNSKISGESEAETEEETETEVKIVTKPESELKNEAESEDVQDNASKNSVENCLEVASVATQEPQNNYEDGFSNSQKSEKEKLFKEKEKHKQKKKDSNKESLYAKMERYKEIIESKEFLNAFELCKKSIGKILKALLPDDWEVRGVVGFDNPEMNGKICALMGMLYPFIRKNVHVTCDFENEIIDLKAKARGELFVCTILFVGVKVFFNRNIRRVIKMFNDAKTVGNDISDSEAKE